MSLPNNSEVKDPLLIFLESTIHGAASISNRKPTKDRIALWRQGKEESFSDWTIVLREKNHELMSDDMQLTDVGASATSNCQNIFYVHRNILSSVSVYFKSQFRSQVETAEGRNFTSIVHLHQNAIDAFPVFLDYLYSPEQGKMMFQRENAVALRHLAIYFGVDVLLEEITHIILEDMKIKSSREIYHNSACLFLDDVLLESLKLMDTRQEAFMVLAEAIHTTLIEDPEIYLSNDNAVILAWQQIMSNIDMGCDVFFATKNTERYPDLHATAVRVKQNQHDPYYCNPEDSSADGLKHVLGTYKLVGAFDGVGLFTNGVCFLHRLDQIWYISIGNNKEWTEKKIYQCISNSDYPPPHSWEALINDQNSISFQISNMK